MKLNEAIEAQGFDKLKHVWLHIDKVLLATLIFFLAMLGTLSAIAQPTIVSFSPANLSAHIARDVGTLTIEFDRNVYVGQLAESYDQFDLKLLFSSTPLQSFEVDDPSQVTVSGSTITLHNVQTLGYGESYYITTPRAGIVEDAEGNGLDAIVGNGVWRFTIQKSDLIVASTFPANGAQFVEADATTDFTITFNESVYTSPPYKYAYLQEIGGSVVDSWTLSLANDVTIDGNIVTLHRSSSSMELGKEYYIYTSADAFRDQESRYFEGIGNNETDFWHFTTKSEADPPQISSLDPAHEEEGVDPAQTVFTIRFNEGVSIDRAGYIELYLKTKSGATLVDQADPQDIVYNKGNYQIPFDGHGGLTAGGQYYISIGDNIFHDSQENYFAGTNIDNWSFLANRNPTSISLSNSSVVENQSAGAVVGTISAIDPDQGDNATVTLVSGTGSTHNASFQIVGSQLQTTEALDYEDGATRSIRVRATDNVGGTREQILTINVGDSDDTPPVLLTSDPDDGATGVDLSPTLIYTFNEDIALTDAVTSTFYLRKTSNNASVASWQAVDGSPLPAGMSIVGDQMIFEVNTVLEYNTEYYLSAPEISDLAGNDGNPFSNNSFTTRALSSETQVLAANIPGVVGDPVIDNENNTITATVQATSPSRIDIDLDLSPGATFSFSSNPQYYQNGVPFPMTVRAEANNFESWTITLNWESMSGTYTVGPNGDFEKLSNAFGQFGFASQAGDIVFVVEDGYDVAELLQPYNPDPTYSVLVRPESGATNINLRQEYGGAIRLGNSSNNIVFDGADPSTGNIAMQINVDGFNSSGIQLVSGTHNISFQNLRFNIVEGYGVEVIGTTTSLVADVNFMGCEFVASNTAADVTIYGLNIDTSNLDNIDVIGNKFYNVEGAPDPSRFVAISSNDYLSNVYNNSISIRGNITVGISRATNVLHNSIHLYGTGSETDSYHYAIGYGTNIQNNNVSIERTSGTGTTRRFVHYSNMQAEDAGNNVHILDDGVSVTRFALNAADETEMSSIASTTTFVDAEFTDASVADLSLSGGSYSDSDLRTSPVDGVDTDILGNSRSASWPSKGAYEVPNRASDFLTFSIPQQVSTPAVNSENHTVLVAVNAGTSLTNLVPTFTISPGASIDKVSGDEQDFTNPVSYFITDEQETAQQEWVVTVSEQNLPPTEITLSPSAINENEESGTIVGVLSGTDPNGDELVFTLVTGEGDDHNGSFLIDADSKELKSTAPFDFEQNEELYIRIQADDQNGETYEEALVVSIVDVDEIDPEVEGYGPASGDVDVALDSEFYIQYDEDVFANTGSYFLRTADGQLVEELAVDGSGVGVSRAVVTLTPSVNLKYNTSYYVETVPNVVADEAGNPAPAIPAGSWSFTTENPIASLSPADEADDVSPFADIELTIDRSVSLQTGGTFRMFKKSNDAQIGTDYSFNSATIDGNTVTYDIPMNLEPGVEIYINIIDGIEDSEGNSIDILGKDTWSFTPVKLDQTVTLNPITAKTFGEDDFTFTVATSTSGEAITYSSSVPGVAEVADNYVTIHSAGSTMIRATQAGNTYYNSAFAEQEFVVNKANQTLLFEGAEDMVYGDESQLLEAFAVPSGNEVSFEIVSGDAVTLDTETNEVTVVGTGEVTIRAASLESDNYYAPEAVERSFTVEKKMLTVTVEDQEKIYGEANPDLTIVYDGFVNGETRSVIETDPTASTEADETSRAGLYDISLAGGEDENYSFEFEDGFLRIYKKTLITQVEDATRTYGEANPGFVLSFEGFIEGETSSDLLGTLPTRYVDADESSEIGEYTITVSGGTDINYEFVPQNGILTITKAELNVNVLSAEKDYGEDNPTFEFEIDGFKNGESEAVLITQPQLSTMAIKSSDAGDYAITGSGAEAENYSFDYDHGTLTIHKVNLNVSVQDDTRVYGEANPEFVIAYDGFIEGDDASELDNPIEAYTEADVNSNVGTYDIELSAETDTNYNIFTTSGTLTINPAQQIIVVEDITDKVKNAAPFDVVASVNSDTELQYAVSDHATNSGKTITLTGTAGTVIVTVTAPASLNYLEDTEQITFEVNDKQAQQITFNVVDQTYGGEVVLSGTSDSSLPVSYEIVSGPLALNNGVLTFTGVGAASVRAIQVGDETYNEAVPKVANFSISKAPLTITATDKSMVFGESLPELTMSYSGFVNGEGASSITLPTVATAATGASDAGTYHIELAGGAADNYSMTLIDGVLTVEKATATISLAELIHEADGTAKLPTVATDPADLNVSVTYDGVAEAPTAAGSYEVVATINESNYQGSVTGTLVINEATVTGIATQQVEISVFPNPAAEWLQFSGLSSEAQLDMVDIEGSQVLTRLIYPGDKVDISQMQTGMYVLHISNNHITTTTKILIH
ncbi:Ig-like domain-containing protein [Reichenbachiella carrageenanivorans]|uniref:Ig-like domain-containing protein n=1 Tax=Reichenbachiella carrageenanivorans TaxID=2979869 RepID=A0ABY6D3V1_9BACT|nr:MBG domain-containing protein [Reichenbachiella carrageenanivorans]UXX80827.1 Ig-like domain-containing protein [Reichenbachiella carrageenanivorans]